MINLANLFYLTEEIMKSISQFIGKERPYRYFAFSLVDNNPFFPHLCQYQVISAPRYLYHYDSGIIQMFRELIYSLITPS